MPTITIGENTGDTYAGVIDTQIKENAPTTGYGTDTYMEATSYTSGDRTHALIAFTAPSLGATIAVTSASLDIRQQDAAVNTRTIDLYEVTRAITASATWNTYDGTNAWGTAGALGTGDVGSSALVSASITATSPEYKSWSSAALAAYVQTQINAAAPMRFRLTRNPLTAYDFTFNTFCTSNDVSGNRPKLTITYIIVPAQRRFRWRNDDGSEVSATWAAAEDTNLTGPLG